MNVHRTAFSLFILVVILLIPDYGRAQTRPWITGYYPHWWYAEMTPNDIDYSKLTHIVIFSANPTRTPPYLDVLTSPKDSEQVEYGVLTGRPAPYLEQTVTRAHSKGVSVVISVGGISGEGAQTMSWLVQEQGRIEAFVVAACAYAKRKHLDGIELDWEFPMAADRQGHNLLIKRFRRELDSWKPRGLLLAAVHQAPWSLFGYDRDPMVASFDQINLMTYEMYAGDFSRVRTGYNSPLEQPKNVSDYSGYAINQKGAGPKDWISKGFPASKLGLGISFLTTEFSGVQPPAQPGRPFAGHNWGYLKNVPRTGRHWDENALVPWQGSADKMITYEDTVSCRYKAQYANQLGLGGVMIYELGAGYLPDEPAKDQLLTSVRDALWGIPRAKSK